MTEDPKAINARRLEVVSAIDTAIANYLEVVEIAHRSDSPADVVTALAERFGFNEVQATAVMDVQIRRLSRLERNKIRDHRGDLDRET